VGRKAQASRRDSGQEGQQPSDGAQIAAEGPFEEDRGQEDQGGEDDQEGRQGRRVVHPERALEVEHRREGIRALDRAELEQEGGEDQQRGRPILPELQEPVQSWRDPNP
jgi:hypothetical protein